MSHNLSPLVVVSGDTASLPWLDSRSALTVILRDTVLKNVCCGELNYGGDNNIRRK
ncbi:hypothetical protein H1Q63_09715 [Desmonostoc muscorum CCALA 125]|nr:hypothetical protein [Desmonostoc muscorum CCALA 125]